MDFLSGSEDMPYGDDYTGDWGGSTSLAPSESSWSFLPAGSQIVDHLVGSVATGIGGLFDAAKPRIVYEMNRPVITATNTGSKDWVILLALLGVGVYLLTR